MVRTTIDALRHGALIAFLKRWQLCAANTFRPYGWRKIIGQHQGGNVETTALVPPTIHPPPTHCWTHIRGENRRQIDFIFGPQPRRDPRPLSWPLYSCSAICSDHIPLVLFAPPHCLPNTLVQTSKQAKLDMHPQIHIARLQSRQFAYQPPGIQRDPQHL